MTELVESLLQINKPDMFTPEEIHAAWEDFYGGLCEEEFHNLDYFSPK
jgi:hypothetical protein